MSVGVWCKEIPGRFDEEKKFIIRLSYPPLQTTGELIRQDYEPTRPPAQQTGALPTELTRQWLAQLLP